MGLLKLLLHLLIFENDPEPSDLVSADWALRASFLEALAAGVAQAHVLAGKYYCVDLGREADDALLVVIFLRATVDILSAEGLPLFLDFDVLCQYFYFVDRNFKVAVVIELLLRA